MVGILKPFSVKKCFKGGICTQTDPSGKDDEKCLLEFISDPKPRQGLWFKTEGSHSDRVPEEKKSFALKLFIQLTNVLKRCGESFQNTAVLIMWNSEDDDACSKG